MAEQTDKGGEEETKESKEQAAAASAETSGSASGPDLEALVKHYQSKFNQAESALKKTQEQLDQITQAQEAATKKDLEEKEEFKKLYQGEQTKVADLTAAQQKLDLQVKLQAHLAEKAPDYIPDYKWIAPHVDSEENLASVVEDYVKTHPKSPGTGSASLGNKSKDGKNIPQVAKADLSNPIELARLRAEDKDFDKKLLAGEIDVI